MSLPELRRRYVYDALRTIPVEDIPDVYLRKTPAERAPRRRRATLPDDVIHDQIAHISSFLETRGLKGRPLTAMATGYLSPDNIEQLVNEQLRPGQERPTVRREVIHSAMGELHSMGGLVGMQRYTRNNQVPEQLRMQHQSYIELCLREMGLNGELHPEATRELSPMRIENEVMRKQIGAQNRRRAGLTFKGVSNETGLNQITLDLISERMQALHARGKLLKK
jgi:hypothetical protein